MGFATVGQALAMPETLCLQTNYEPTVSFLNALREELGGRWRTWYESPKVRADVSAFERSGKEPYFDRYWDFSKIKRLTPEVALLIAAEFDVVTRDLDHVFNGALEIERWDKSVVNLLHGIGFFEITKVTPPSDAIIAGSNYRILRFRAGSIADGTYVKSLLQELGLPELLESADIFSAIAEAITNTKHHAYNSSVLVLPMLKDWWMTGFILPQERRVSISVWDRGLTIPTTLPSWGRYPFVERAIRKLMKRQRDMTASNNDGAAIRFAMAAGRSSTYLSYRGKGLPLIESIVDLCAVGHIRIHSRRGTYERAKGSKPVAINRSSELSGTLITWDWQFHAE